MLDEIEKAHADVFNILLQVLDDGRLTDGHGRTVDFRNTVIVMTSNLGSDLIQEMSADSEYDNMKEIVMNEVSHHFRPEFLNRIDDVVVSHALTQEQIDAIAEIQIDRLRKRLQEQDIALEISAETIGQAGFDPIYGTRPLKRAIQDKVEIPIAEKILLGHMDREQLIKIDISEGKLQFSIVETNAT